MFKKSFTPLEKGKYNRKQKFLTGFTLIELIVVIAIIAILAAIIAPNAFKAIEKAKISKAIADWEAFKAAAGTFYADTGHWPGTSGRYIRVENAGFFSDPGYSGWDGPYLESNITMHPWGGVYWLSRNLDYNDNGIKDLDLEMGDECKEGGLGCEVPRSVALKIDEMIDDGDLETGNVRYENVGSSPGYRDFRKLLFYDTN